MSQPQPAQFQGFPFIGYWSDQGKARENNEDRFYVPPKDLSPDVIQRKGYLCIVADGMGGYAKGEVASDMAVRRVAETYYADPNLNPEQSLRHAIQMANADVYSAAQNSEMVGMGTTMVAVVSVGKRVIVANIGDSRAYLISQSQASQITRDHSWVQERIDEKLLTEEQARHHAQKNLITRALGTKPQVQIDTFTPAAELGETILLCSDGLSNVVTNEELAHAVSSQPPQAAARQLVDLANERGGPDNITIVIMGIVPDATQLTVMAPRPRQKTHSMMPLVAGSIAGLVLLLVILALVFNQNQATQLAASFTQTVGAQTSIAMAALPPVQPTPPAVASQATSTSVPTIAPTLTLSPTIAPTRTVTPTAIVPSPPTVPPAPTPPQDVLAYDIPRLERQAFILTKTFLRIANPALLEYRQFFKDHPEIQDPQDQDIISKLAINDPRLGELIAKITGGPLIMKWNDLKPVQLTDPEAISGHIVWLSLLVDDQKIRIPGLGDLGLYKGCWVLARAVGNKNGAFDIDPKNFIFAWNGNAKAYRQAVCPLKVNHEMGTNSEGNNDNNSNNNP